MKKVLALVLVTLMVFGSVAFAGRLEEPAVWEGEEVTLTYGWQPPWFDESDPKWPTMTMQAVCQYLNLDIDAFVWDSYEQLAVDVASADMPDLFSLYGFSKELIQSEQVLNLDEYLDKMPAAQDYIKNNPIAYAYAKKEFSDLADGWYYVRPGAGKDCMGYVNTWVGYNFRWDLYAELGYPEIKTEDDYISLMADYIAEHPTTENGLPIYGMAWCDNGLADYTRWSVIYGDAGNYHLDGSGVTYCYADADSGFWKALEFCFKLNQAGIWDPDSFTMKREDVEAKIANGQYVAHGPANVLKDTYYEAAYQQDKDALCGFMNIPVEGLQINMNYYKNLGNSVYVGINSNCKNLDAALTLFNFQFSEYGERFMLTGPQGVSWDYDENDTPYVIEGAGQIEDLGRFWNLCAMDSQFNTLSDGGFVNLFVSEDVIKRELTTLDKNFSEHYGVSYPLQAFTNLVDAGKAFDSWNENCDAEAFIDMDEDEWNAISEYCEDLLYANLANLIMAEDYDAFISLRDELIAEMIDAGADEYMAELQRQWEEAIEFVNSFKG